MAKSKSDTNLDPEKSKKIRLLVILIFALIISDAMFIAYIKNPFENPSVKEYNPVINPDNFSSKINNQYFTLLPGTNYVYEAETSEGLERNEVYVTEETKKVMGVDTRVVWDRVWLDGELIEDTKDWYAQDSEGNVWYFGEDSKEMKNGEVVSSEGSWEAGVDGAKPGIIMKANPVAGDLYRQEYYKGRAEDMGEVVSLGEKVSTTYKNFSNCIKTKDWSLLDKKEEYKFYCPNAGNVVLEIEDDEKIELTDMQLDVEPGSSDSENRFDTLSARHSGLREVSDKIYRNSDDENDEESDKETEEETEQEETQDDNEEEPDETFNNTVNVSINTMFSIQR